MTRAVLVQRQERTFWARFTASHMIISLRNFPAIGSRPLAAACSFKTQARSPQVSCVSVKTLGLPWQ